MLPCAIRATQVLPPSSVSSTLAWFSWQAGRSPSGSCLVPFGPAVPGARMFPTQESAVPGPSLLDPAGAADGAAAADTPSWRVISEQRHGALRALWQGGARISPYTHTGGHIHPGKAEDDPFRPSARPTAGRCPRCRAGRARAPASGSSGAPVPLCRLNVHAKNTLRLDLSV